MLGEMVASGYFVKDGYGRWASYRLNPGIFDDLEQSDNDSAPPITLPKSEQTLIHNSSSSPHSELSSPHSSPVLNDPTLLAVANPSREKSRLPPEETEAIIYRLCSGRFLTYLEIGGLLGRDAKKTRDRFLSAMVTAGRLRLQFSLIAIGRLVIRAIAILSNKTGLRRPLGVSKAFLFKHFLLLDCIRLSKSLVINRSTEPRMVA